MDSDEFLRTAAVLVILLGNAFFVAAEYALVTARRSHLAELSERGDGRATVALELTRTPLRFVSTVQVGVTLFSILLGAVGAPLFEQLLAPALATTLAYAAAFVLLTAMHVVLGELVPKAVALARREQLALQIARPLYLFSLVVRPFVVFLDAASTLLTRPLGIALTPAGVAVETEADIRLLVAEAEEAGVIEEAEEEMLYKVFDLADKEVRLVMVARPDVDAISVDYPPSRWLAEMTSTQHTRYPVYRASLDDLVGILNVHDFLSAMAERGLEAIQIEELVRPAYVVPETKNVGALLTELRHRHEQMAIVVDEYGSVQGIATLEDLLEQIVGEIADEYELPDESLVPTGEGAVLVHGPTRSTTSTSSSASSSRSRTTTRSSASSSASWDVPPEKATRPHGTGFASAWSRPTAGGSTCSRRSCRRRLRPRKSSSWWCFRPLPRGAFVSYGFSEEVRPTCTPCSTLDRVSHADARQPSGNSPILTRRSPGGDPGTGSLRVGDPGSCADTQPAHSHLVRWLRVRCRGRARGTGGGTSRRGRSARLPPRRRSRTASPRTPPGWGSPRRSSGASRGSWRASSSRSRLRIEGGVSCRRGHRRAPHASCGKPRPTHCRSEARRLRLGDEEPSECRCDWVLVRTAIRASPDGGRLVGREDGPRGWWWPRRREDEMIGEIAVVPQIEGPARETVANAVREIDAQGLRYEVGPTGTSVEGELTAILDAVRAIESRLRADGVRRALIEVRLQLEPHEETLEHQVEGLASPAA